MVSSGPLEFPKRKTQAASVRACARRGSPYSWPRVSEPRNTGWARLSSVRIGAVVAIALAAAFVIWLLVRRNDDSSTSSTASTTTAVTAKPIGPVAATPAALRSVSAQDKRPVYWVGPRSGQTYELTRTAAGSVYVRYLPPGAKIGNRRADYTIVGTYPKPNALSVLQDLAKQPNEKSVPAPGRARCTARTPRRTSTSPFQAPTSRSRSSTRSATGALRLVTSGRVAPVENNRGLLLRGSFFRSSSRRSVRLRTAGPARRGRAAARPGALVLPGLAPSSSPASSRR